MATDVPVVVVYAGDTAIWPTYTFTDASNNPRDLIAEGWGQWAAQWRLTPDAKTPIQLAVDATNAASGVIKISLDSINTELMGANGVWDLQAVNGETVKTWLRGKTKWIQDVTRA